MIRGEITSMCDELTWLNVLISQHVFDVTKKDGINFSDYFVYGWGCQ